MTQNELLQRLVASGSLKTPRIIETFKKVDRAQFVRGKSLKDAYNDYPLPIGHGATISQPSTVAFMLETLQPKAGDKVLDVGSGSAWTTALLAHMVREEGKVYGVEMEPKLVEFGRKNIEKYKFNNVFIEQAQDVMGLPEYAPYDEILVSAAAETLPKELVDQLKPGGRMVIPVQSSLWRVDKISDTKIKKEEFFGFSFVPLR